MTQEQLIYKIDHMLHDIIGLADRDSEIYKMAQECHGDVHDLAFELSK